MLRQRHLGFWCVLTAVAISLGFVTVGLGQPPASPGEPGPHPPAVVGGPFPVQPWGPEVPHPPAFGVPVAVTVAEQAKGSPWWIGIQCRSVDPALREQLGLAEGVGLLVEEVVPDSPASKAGIKRFDVLVAAGEKELRSVQDLIDVINRSEGKEVRLKYVRRGQEAELSVTPERRPPAPGIFVWPGPGEGPRGPQREFFRGPGFFYRFYYPGRVVPPKEGPAPPIPGNLAITITKQGNEPAKITVKRDGESWEVTEGELDKLPEDIRPHVEQMLRGMAPPPADRRQPPLEWPGFELVWPAPEWWGLPEDRAVRERIERELKELNRRLEELRQRVDEMWKRAPGRQVPGRPRGGAQPPAQGETT